MNLDIVSAYDIEKRTTYATDGIVWLYGQKEWVNLLSIGAIHMQFSTEKGTSDK